MKGQKLSELLNDIDDDLLTDALPPDWASEAVPPKKPRILSALGRVMDSGWAAAILSVLVSVGVLTAIILAGRSGQNPDEKPPLAGDEIGGQVDGAQPDETGADYLERPAEGVDEPGERDETEIHASDETEVVWEGMPDVIPYPDAALTLSPRGSLYSDVRHMLSKGYLLSSTVAPTDPDFEGPANQTQGSGAVAHLSSLGKELESNPCYLDNCHSLIIRTRDGSIRIVGVQIFDHDLKLLSKQTAADLEAAADGTLFDLENPTKLTVSMEVLKAYEPEYAFFFVITTEERTVEGGIETVRIMEYPVYVKRYLSGAETEPLGDAPVVLQASTADGAAIDAPYIGAIWEGYPYFYYEQTPETPDAWCGYDDGPCLSDNLHFYAKSLRQQAVFVPASCRYLTFATDPNTSTVNEISVFDPQYAPVMTVSGKTVDIDALREAGHDGYYLIANEFSETAEGDKKIRQQTEYGVYLYFATPPIDPETDPYASETLPPTPVTMVPTKNTLIGFSQPDELLAVINGEVSADDPADVETVMREHGAPAWIYDDAVAMIKLLQVLPAPVSDAAFDYFGMPTMIRFLREELALIYQFDRMKESGPSRYTFTLYINGSEANDMLEELKRKSLLLPERITLYDDTLLVAVTEDTDTERVLWLAMDGVLVRVEIAYWYGGLAGVDTAALLSVFDPHSPIGTQPPKPASGSLSDGRETEIHPEGETMPV